MTAYERVTNALETRTGTPIRNGMTRCPSHDDSTSSLAVTAGNDGTVLVKCHAGCATDVVLGTVGLELKDLFEPKDKSKPIEISATYDYVDEHNVLLYQVVRLVPKSFRQRRPEGNGWSWKLGDTRRVPYRLPVLLAAIKQGRWIVIVEGEKDADALMKAGIVATCNPGGAGKWRPEWGFIFKGAKVAIIPDNDKPGHDHAQTVADMLRPVAEVVKIVELEGLKEHGDVSDWLVDHDVAELKALIRSDSTMVEPVADRPQASEVAESCHLGAVLDEVGGFLDGFMAFSSPEQLDAITLWIAGTHAAEHFDTCAYLFVNSAEKRSGKSLLLDLLEQLVRRGRSTANISPAALFRMVEEMKPTLLFDECDQFFAKGKNADPSKSEIVGLINAGFRRGRPAYRMGGKNMRELEEFDPYCPKALAGIGGCLPDTTEDRCIRIVLQRKARGVAKARYRIRIHELEARRLGDRLAAVVDPVARACGQAFPKLPDQLSDRAQDVWEGLLAIADVAGGDWPDRARAAAVKLHTEVDPEESLGTKLLGDIREVFTAEKLLTKQLVERLNDLEEAPWGEWRGGNGISAQQVITRLKPYGLKSKRIRLGAEVGRGFDRDQFDDAFARYLDAPGVGVDTAVHSVHTGLFPQVNGVNTTETAGVHAGVHASAEPLPAETPDEEPAWPPVNGVNGGEPGCDFDAGLIGGGRGDF